MHNVYDLLVDLQEHLNAPVVCSLIYLLLGDVEIDEVHEESAVRLPMAGAPHMKPSRPACLVPAQAIDALCLAFVTADKLAGEFLCALDVIAMYRAHYYVLVGGQKKVLVRLHHLAHLLVYADYVHVLLVVVIDGNARVYVIDDLTDCRAVKHVVGGNIFAVNCHSPLFIRC